MNDENPIKRDLPVMSFGNPLVMALIKAGVVPKNVVRVIIDMPLEGCIKIHCEYLADGRIIDPVVLEAVSEIATIIREKSHEQFIK